MSKMLGQPINRESDHALRLALLRADELVAGLLLDLSAWPAKRGYAADEFTLRMTRDHIGSYLGLTLETASRTLSHFDRVGLINAMGKAVRIRDFERLRSIAQCLPTPAPFDGMRVSTRVSAKPSGHLLAARGLVHPTTMESTICVPAPFSPLR
jgi:hypothetical protein